MLDVSLIEQSINMMSSSSCIEDAISVLKSKTIYIYGAGSFGKEMYILLKNYDVSVKAFLDKNADKINMIDDVKVYSLNDEFIAEKDNIAVLFAIVMDKENRNGVINLIKDSGYENVIEAQSLRCLLVDFDKCEELSEFDYIKSQEENIYRALNLWEDEKSKDIYICNIYSHLTGDYSKCNLFESSMSEQYFPQDIKMFKGYSHFIDCGGYIGDTVLQLVGRHNVDDVVSFEPNIENFKKLSCTCDSVDSDKNIHFTLFPCAVSNDVRMVKFANCGGSGTISKSGDVVIQSVSIDEVLKNSTVTFIKMDIEGEEMNALYGAKNTIKNQKPDLAICVYHCINHLWDIVLFLKNLNPSYKFYLRNYNAYTMETVMYATCDE